MLNRHRQKKVIPEFSESWSDERKLLHFVGCGDLDEVINLIRRGTSVNYRHWDGTVSGTSCLHLAVGKEDPPMVYILLQAGAMLDVFNKWGHTPLHVAARRHILYLRMLIIRGANVNAVDEKPLDSEGCYPIHEAVKDGHFEAVECLIENGADVNVFDSSGQTPLHIAVTRGFDMLKLLIEKGANVNAIRDRERNQRTFLLRSIQSSSSTMDIFRMSEGRSPIATKGCYPLHIAVHFAKFGVVKLLLKHGADVNATDVEGRSILYYAVRSKNGEILNLLLKSGAKFDPDSARGDGTFNETNPLILAAGELNNIAIVNMLLNTSTKLERRCRETAALYEALKWGHKDMAELLLRREAKVNVLDADGKSALYHAAEVKYNRGILGGIKPEEYNEILKLLFWYGAKASNDDHVRAILRNSILRGNNFTLRLLYRKGIRLEKLRNCTDSEKPPLHLALRNSDVNVLEHLLNTTLFHIDARGSDRKTALYEAIDDNSFRHVKILLKWQANPNLICYDKTPLELAVDKRYKHLVEVLLFAGADVTDFSNSFFLCHGVSESLLARIRSVYTRKNLCTVLQYAIKHVALINVLLNSRISLVEFSVPRVLHDDTASTQFYKECIAEARLMNETILCGQITLLDIFSFERFRTCLMKICDANVVADEVLAKCFPIYGKPIRQRITQILDTRKLRQEAVLGLSVILRKNVEPYAPIHSKIMDHLNPQDLRHLRAIAAFGRY